MSNFSKKKAQEDLEQDILLDTFSKAQSFYDQNKTAVIAAAIAFIIVVGGSLGYYYYSTSQESQAQKLMTNATQAYLNQEYQNALTGSEANFTVGFEQIINNYSMTDAANLARYYASVCEYQLGNPEQALSYINAYEVPEGILGVGPLSFKGVILTTLGNHEEAAGTYIQAAEWDVNDSTTPYNYLEAARAFRDAGNSDKASEYAQMIISEYGQSSQVAEAQKIKGSLATAQ